MNSSALKNKRHSNFDATNTKDRLEKGKTMIINQHTIVTFYYVEAAFFLLYGKGKKEQLKEKHFLKQYIYNIPFMDI